MMPAEALATVALGTAGCDTMQEKVGTAVKCGKLQALRDDDLCQLSHGCARGHGRRDPWGDAMPAD